MINRPDTSIVKPGFLRPDYSGGLDEYTKLLLHMSGTDGSQDFIDETGKTITVYSNACLKGATSTLNLCYLKTTYYESGHWGSSVPINAFDNTLTTNWQGSADNSWLCVDLGIGNETCANGLALTALLYGSSAQLKDFVFSGSNDTTNGSNGNWDVLLSATHANNGDRQVYSFANGSRYRFYKIYVDTSYRTDFLGAGIREMELLFDGVSLKFSIPPKFGETSGCFDGAGDFLTNTSDDFAFGLDDFTIDGWTYMYNGGHGDSWSRIFETEHYSTAGGLALTTYNAENPARLSLQLSTGTIMINTDTYLDNYLWHHIAVIRHLGKIRLAIRGKFQSTVYSTPQNFTSGKIAIGGNLVGSESFRGYMAEFRVSKGIARWTSDFIPPANPYSRRTFM